MDESRTNREVFEGEIAEACQSLQSAKLVAPRDVWVAGSHLFDAKMAIERAQAIVMSVTRQAFDLSVQRIEKERQGN